MPELDKKAKRREYLRLYMQKWRKENPEKIIDINLKYYKKKKDERKNKEAVERYWRKKLKKEEKTE